jgi:hypothetical protein
MRKKEREKIERRERTGERKKKENVVINKILKNHKNWGIN